MISLFAGELLLHPIPLEMSMSACSHRCVYCFANLRKQNRLFDAKGFANQLSKMYESKTLVSTKLREGWPVCISNLTDPFSDNNLSNTESVLSQFIAKKIPVFIQTKTGSNMIDLVSDLPKSTFYITITCFLDVNSKKIEPFAPSTSERIEYIKKLIDLGHNVIVGINPLAQEWMSADEFELILKELEETGVTGIFTQQLNLNKKNNEVLAKRDFAGIKLSNYYPPFDGAYFQGIVEKYHSRNVVSYNQPFYSNGWKSTRECYPNRSLLTMQDFVNLVIDTYKTDKGDLFFNDFYSFFKENFESFFNTEHRLDDYVISVARAAWKGQPRNQNIIGAKHLLRVFWNTKTLKISPQNNLIFERIGTDGAGNAVIRYSGGQFVRNGKIVKLKTNLGHEENGNGESC